jgi:SAM-dependent methyltransferase
MLLALYKLKKQLKLAMQEKLLRGDGVNCHVCNRSYKHFFTYLGRPNAKCPNCGSLERVRLIYKFITDLQLINAQTKLLHIAPEPVLYKIFSKELGANYIPADKFEPGYKYPKGTQHIDITALPFADDSFDGLICIHVLEHVQDDTKALSELYRVLKKGGFAILQVPYEADRAVTYEDASITGPEERRKHFLQADHVRIYGTDYVDRFLKPGFTIEHGDYSKNLSAETREKLGLKDEEIFLLRK